MPDGTKQERHSRSIRVKLVWLCLDSPVVSPLTFSLWRQILATTQSELIVPGYSVATALKGNCPLAEVEVMAGMSLPKHIVRRLGF